MKTLIALLFLAFPLFGQTYADEVTVQDTVFDRVLYHGKDSGISFHVIEKLETTWQIEQHRWCYEVVKLIPNEKIMLIDDYELVRTCEICDRVELVHTYTYSKKVE